MNGKAESSERAATPHNRPFEASRGPPKDELCCRCCSGGDRVNPGCLQCCASLKIFLFNVCLLLCFAAAGLSSFEGSVTTLETRYQLSSSQIGLGASLFTAGTAVSTVVITHFGGRPSSRRPVWLATGGLCLAAGAAAHALPQFVLGPYRPPELLVAPPADANSTSDPAGPCLADVALNATGSEDQSCQEEEKQILQDNNIAYVIIILGQALLGVGYGPLVPLTLAYIDDNADRGTTGLASGIMESMFGVGAIVGFQLASAVFTLWVDFYRDDAVTVDGLTPRDHGWVGAWWLSMLVLAAIFLVLSLPLLGFPRRLPRRRRQGHEADGGSGEKADKIDLQEEEEEEEEEVVVARPVEDEKVSALMDLKEWPRSVWRLMKNPTFLLASLSYVTEGAIIYSLAAFFPKYMQVQFGLDVFSANLIAGFAFVPPWALGALIGGIIVKKFGSHIRGSSAMGVVSCVIACCLSVALIFVGCNNPPIAGVTVPYPGESLDGYANLKSACNAECLCPEETAYNPHCGPGGITYFSPCHAGCPDIPTNNTYEFCSCSILDPPSTPSDDVTSTEPPSTVTRGYCPYNCSSRVTFIVLMVLWAMFLSSVTSPRIIVIVSSVHPSDKSLALGLSRVLMLLIGSLPFPFLYGTCIDSSCLVWQHLCGERGSCSIYDIEQYRLVIYSLTAALVAVQALAFAGVWLKWRAAKDAEHGDDVGAPDVPPMLPSSGSANEGFASGNAL